MEYKVRSDVDRKMLLQPHSTFGCLTLDMGEDEDVNELRDTIYKCLKFPNEQSWYALNDLFQQGLLKYLTIEQFYQIMNCLINYLIELPQRTTTTFHIIYECVKKFKLYLTPEIVQFLLSDSLQLLTKTSKLSVTNNVFSTLYLIIQMLNEEQQRLFFTISLDFFKNSTALDSFPHATFMLCFHEFFSTTSNVLEYFKIFFPVLQTFLHIKQWTVPKDCLELIKIVFTRDPLASQLFIRYQNQQLNCDDPSVHINSNSISSDSVCNIVNNNQKDNNQYSNKQIGNSQSNNNISVLCAEELEFFLIDFLKQDFDTLSADAIDLYSLFIKCLNYVPNVNFLKEILHFLPTQCTVLELSVLKCFTAAIRFSADAVLFFAQSDIFSLFTNYSEMNFTQRNALLTFAYEALNETSAFLPAIRTHCTELVVDQLESADVNATLLALRVALELVEKCEEPPFEALDMSTAAEIENEEIRATIEQINHVISEKYGMVGIDT